MFGSQILEVAIGIIFMFILVSTVCTTIREGIEALVKTRAAYLEYMIRQILHDKDGKGLASSFYNHPLIYGLFSEEYKPGINSKRPAKLARGKNLPSYIPSKNFARALMDIAARGPETDAVSSDPDAPVISLASIRANILNIRNVAVQRVLLTAIDSAQGDINKAQLNIEDWYNSAMDRVSGWYKRSSYWIIFWIGLFVAVGMNVNTITIADYLSTNDVARAATVKRAEIYATDTTQGSQSYENAMKELDEVSLPIGWSAGWGAPHPSRQNDFNFWNDIFGPILGWLITALAATLGAPFWFDLLNKIMVIRSTVKPHEKSLEEGSEDRQNNNKQIAAAGQPAAGQGAAGNNANPGGGNLPSPAMSTSSGVRDAESSIDGCDVAVQEFTEDEDLPPAEGGVA